MAWLILVVSGLLEVGWAALLPATHGFTRVLPSVAMLVLLAASMAGLSIAVRSIPIGTAYAVWVGIGAAGAAAVGIVVYGEAPTAARLGFLALLIASVIGLKLTGSAH